MLALQYMYGIMRFSAGMAGMAFVTPIGYSPIADGSNLLISMLSIISPCR